MKQNIMLNNTLVGAALLLTAGLANAGEGFSIGASAARAAVDIQQDGIDINGDANGYRIFGLYMISKNFGVEAGFSAFGEPDDSRIPSDMEVEISSYDLFAVGKYPLGENFSLFGKAGFATSNTETEIGDDDETETHHQSTDLALGFGGQYDFGERFGIRSEIEWLNGVDAGAVRTLSVSGVWRFK